MPDKEYWEMWLAKRFQIPGQREEIVDVRFLGGNKLLSLFFFVSTVVCTFPRCSIISVENIALVHVQSL
jgi:hypothetical protein